MTAERQIYLLDPMRLPPETIAVAFAKTSRSPESFRQIAAELTEEKSSEFHEKWVVGYGHASVAEHAMLHIAVENISRLAVESLESNRLASYTEKSTRYQKWGPEDFYVPAELDGHPLRELFVDTCRLLFETYHQMLEPMRAVIVARTPRSPGESDSAFNRRIRSDYIDVCRFLLPSAALANVGMTINARALEHALRKMLSHPLAEVRQIGAEMKEVAFTRLPTLIKYVDRVPYLVEAAQALEASARQMGENSQGEDVSPAGGDWCRLVSCDAEGESRVLAAALYRFSGNSYAQCMLHVRGCPPAERERLAGILLGSKGRFDIPLRELEYTSYTVDLVFDQGGYFELKRHRMMTQTPQPLTALLGYAVPRAIVEAQAETAYHTAMRAAHQAYCRVAESFPAAASYLVPNGFNRRVLLQFNLRSALHLVGLRGAANAHFSMRRAAQRIGDELRAASPLLGAYLSADPGETWQSVEACHFAATAEQP